MPRKKILNKKYKVKTFYCLFTNSKYTSQSMVRLLKNNVEVYNYYFNNLSSELKSEVNRAVIDKFKYLYKIISGTNVYCKYTNKLIPYDRLLRGCETFSDIQTLWGKGTSTRGKKRPGHGKIISQKLMGIKKSQEHSLKLKKRLQSIDFKKIVLANKGIEFTNDLEVYEKYSKLYSDNLKSIQYKTKFVKNNFTRYLDNNEISLEDINLMNEDQIIDLYSELMSIKSSIAMSNSKTMGNAKIITVENINNNLSNLNSVVVRSGMEAKIISFFEKNNLQWNYESKIIDYFYNFNRKYIIDFEFLIDNEIKYLEVKGSVRNIDVDKTLAKIDTAIKKFGFIYVYQGELISLNNLDIIKYDNINKFKIKHIYGDKC